MRTKITFKQRLGEVQRTLATGKMVRAKDLGELVGVSERSVYRYIEALRELGHNITGEAGVGYQMVKNGNGTKPLTQLEIYETLGASYERSAITLREQAARDTVTSSAQWGALMAAAYTADVLRAGALDVVEKLKGQR